jgi:glycosyltransferase involved in cell wall biosynthesis
MKQEHDGCLSEIIVVDSSDDGITKNYLQSMSNGMIRVITSGIKVMPAIQRNIGAEHATGDLLVFIDSDAFPSDGWLKKIIQAYSSGWKAGGGGYRVPEFQLQNKVALAQYYLEFGEYIPVGRPTIKKLLPSCNLFCDRTLFHSVKGFPRIRASEDSLFGLTLSKHSPLFYIPDACVFHIFREDEKHFLNNQFLIGRYIYVYRKHFYNSFYLDGLFFYFFLPAMFMVKLMIVLRRVWKGGLRHMRLFMWSWGYFWKGLLAWTKGFFSGKKDFLKLIAE